MLSSPIFVLLNIKSSYNPKTLMAFAGRTCIQNTKCKKIGCDRIYQASNTCVFVLVEFSCTDLISARRASFVVQFLVVAWGLLRDGIIMMSCSAFDGAYMTSVVSVIFLYPKK